MKKIVWDYLLNHGNRPAGADYAATLKKIKPLTVISLLQILYSCPLETALLKSFQSKTVRFLTGGAIVFGLIGLAGWLFDSLWLRSFLSDGATMKFNTAFIIICTGSSIWCFPVSKRAANLLLSAAAVVCFLSLAEYVLHFHWRFDELLFKDKDTNPLIESPGRTSAFTALNAFLICLAIACEARGRFRLSQALSSFSFFVVYISLMGHLFKVANFYRWGHFSGIAFNTAISLILLNLAVLFSQTKKGWMAVFFKPLNGRLVINYLVIYLIFVLPILVSLYILLIHSAGIPATSATILVIIVSAVLGMPLIYIFLNQINTIGKDLHNANQRLEIAFATGLLGSYELHLASGRMTSSAQCKANFGQKAEAEFNFPELLETVVPEFRDHLLQKVNMAIAEKKLYRATYQVIWPDSSLHWINAFGMPQYDDDGNAVSMLGVTYDVTDQKENDLRKNAFIGMVSHELKTPITSMKAYVQLLNQRSAKKGDEFETNALNKVDIQIRKMTTMINNFLNLSRLESGKIVLDKTDFSLAELIREVTEETSVILPAHEVKLELTEGLIIHADREKIGQVINNLVNNGVKYSSQQKQVEITTTITINEVQMAIKDHGIGISEKYFDRLFDLFFRVEDVVRTHISGFGIGLYLSAEIVRLHGGRIWVESEEGKGSVFYFTLPLA